MEVVRPFVKWAGGKGGLISQLKNFYPFDLENGVIEKYVEPFIGGGALFFALSPDKAIIADSNPELINMYRQVADNVEAVISHLKKYKNLYTSLYYI